MRFTFALGTLAAVVLLLPVSAPAQTISSFIPTQGVQGTTLTLTFAGTALNASAPATAVFTPSAGITVLNTTILSATQAQATIQVDPAAVPGLRVLALQYPSGPVVAGDFIVLAAPPPVLNSVGPGAVSQGTRQLQLTLVGSNFLPGARVVISPPLITLSQSNAALPASDITVDSVRRVSSNLILAVISVSGSASLGLRAVDVRNPAGDNTSFSPGDALNTSTSQPLLVQAQDSLAAPLQAATLAITHPRNGTIVAQGDQVLGQAMLAGTGSGVIIGEWLWDGHVTEQFATSLIGGVPMALQTTQPLPTLDLGPHTLEVRIISPNLLQSRPVTIVVNPGDWRLQRLLAPGSMAAFTDAAPPRLRWTIIPGASYYEVGFATEPYLSAVETWHEVNDTQWQVPEDIWNQLPEGELYWTVRVIETSGDPRRPPPMRRLFHLPGNALHPSAAAPGRTPEGNLLLSWEPLKTKAVYRVSLSSDPEGRQVVRRFLTPGPSLDLRRIESSLKAGETYYWQVEAFSPEGWPMMVGPRQSFVAGEAPTSALPRFRPYQVAAMGMPPGPPDLASQIAALSPGPNQTVSNPRPLISVSFKTKVNPADVDLTLDDTDVTAMSKVADTQVTYEPAIPLAGGQHTATLVVGPEIHDWKFTVDLGEGKPAPPLGGAPTYQPGTDAEPATSPGAPGAAAAKPPETPPAGAPVAAQPAPEAKPGPAISELSGQFSSNTQWISGSQQDSNVLGIAQTFTYENGPWRTEINGSGLLNSIFSPEAQQHAFGRVNDYVFRLAYDRPRWGGNLRFGIVAPVLYTGSEFVTAATPREGVEPSLRTPAGTFAFYANTNDIALGGGAGIEFHQQIRGASWSAPLPKDRASFRLMWLSANDVGAPTTVKFDALGNPIISTDPLAQAGAGDAYGALLQLHLGPQWLWTSEYAWSYNNPDKATTLQRLYGRAWRTGVAGTWKKFAISAIYHDVGPNFATPANPTLTKFSNPNRRAVDALVARPTKLGNFRAQYGFQESDMDNPQKPTLYLHSLLLGWSKNLTATTTVALNAKEMRTLTGDLPPAVLLLPPLNQLALQTNLRDAGVTATVAQRVGTLTLTGTAGRDWLHNHLIAGQDAITSNLNFGANWRATSWFQMQSNLGINWVSMDKNKVGTRRTLTTYIQPMFQWTRTGLSVVPLITINQGIGELASGMMTADAINTSYGGRVVWRMPGPLKFSTLSFEGAKTRVRDNLTLIEENDQRLLLVWTLVWGYRHSATPGEATR